MISGRELLTHGYSITQTLSLVVISNELEIRYINPFPNSALGRQPQSSDRRNMLHFSQGYYKDDGVGFFI